MADETAEVAPTAQADIPQVTFKKRSAKAKSSSRKRVPTPPPASDSDSDFTSSDDDEGRRIKRRRKNAVVTASSASNKTHSKLDDAPEYAAAAPLITSNDATKQTNWYDEQENGELSAKNLLGNTRAKPGAPSLDGTYKGATTYQSFVQKNPNSTSKQFGPMKAATNIRTVTFTDMAPDVCTDYKKTGFCGFGDSCKFAHLRENYRHGWELDRDWEIDTKGKKLAGRTVASQSKRGNQANDEEDEDDKMLENIPFACIICEKPYKNPIVTKCGHYFCESCALQRYRKNPSCAACGAGTGGVFNVAKKLNHLLEKKRERAKRRREQAIENGEEVDGEEDAEATTVAS
ncbi:Pre-mRNA-splicing factor cwc24 [Talaromyces atroroseus]|uniref:Pre-mRNA-splicing factor CWC24 n=1 Tax=Talaromyces atroroseus TaxID=1441469 RepID=A0A225AR60_TALAT|nr:Pre-mRNA-splicing factor cwc24 [Talaromyces atroroseus]OKL57426.1 Pre-mRNA-splicing factor cwc24 [Talaromyces atroroseus]